VISLFSITHIYVRVVERCLFRLTFDANGVAVQVILTANDVPIGRSALMNLLWSAALARM